MTGGRLLCWALLAGPGLLFAQAPARIGPISSHPSPYAPSYAPVQSTPATLPTSPKSPTLPPSPMAPPPTEFGVASPAMSPARPGLYLDQPAHPLPPPAGFTSSSCNFDAMCGDNLFSPDYGAWQVLSGYYYSSKLGPRVPGYDYVPITLRRSWMLTAPSDEHLYRGNWEVLADFTTAGVISSYGSVFAGPSVLLRYNFLGNESNLVPYLQTGAGFMLNDAYKDRTQRAIGQQFEFYLHAHLGVRCFVAKNISLDLELGLQHISNANMADRNLGVNALGGTIGFTYFFPSGAR